MLKPFLLLFASSLVACGASGAPVDHSSDIFYDPCSTVIVQPSERTTASQREGIARAIAVWRDVGLTSLTLDPEESGQRVPIDFKDAVLLFHGIYEPSIGEVRVNNKMTDRALDITIAHELGHAIGLEHVPLQERASLMNPGNSTVAPTPDDERQLHERWSCLAKH